MLGIPPKGCPHSIVGDGPFLWATLCKEDIIIIFYLLLWIISNLIGEKGTILLTFKTNVMNQQSGSFLGNEELPAYTPTSDERLLAVLSHVLCLLVGFLAPLIIYLLKKDESSFIAAHAKESLNFQITCIIIGIVCAILIVVLIGIFLLWALAIAATVLVIVATIRASENKLYRYPFNIRLIK